MPKKKSGPKAGPEVVSLENARKKRLLEGLVAELNSLSGQQTDGVRQMLDLYHQWEEANPDKAVRPVVKLEMVTFGFVGPAGYARCHEPHRVPGVALYGRQSGVVFPSDEDIAADIMCPALENGSCRNVLEAMRSPPCILLGGEIQQALAPRSLNSLTEALFEPDYQDVIEEEQERFDAARKLVRKHEEIEEKASSKPPKGRK